MGRMPFMRPVFLRSKHFPTNQYRAGDVSDAIQFMEQFWTAPKTGEYRRAQAICRSAMDNLITAESARAYFIAAAEHAGILDRSRSRSFNSAA